MRVASPRLVLAVALAACLLPGCRPEGQGDAQLYTRALTETGSYEQARALCQRIRDASARGDCQVAAMESWERLDPDECIALAQGPPELALWRDECMFQLAERMRAAGDLDGALAACVETRFARQCAWHLVQDEAEASLSESPAQAEARLSRFVGVQRLPDAPLQFWLIRMRTAAAAGTPPGEATCTELRDPEPCHQALRRSVRLVLDARLRADRARACAPTSVRDATMQPDPAWLPSARVDVVVDEWRAERCGTTAPSPPPDP